MGSVCEEIKNIKEAIKAAGVLTSATVCYAHGQKPLRRPHGARWYGVCVVRSMCGTEAEGMVWCGMVAVGIVWCRLAYLHIPVELSAWDGPHTLMPPGVAYHGGFRYHALA